MNKYLAIILMSLALSIGPALHVAPASAAPSKGICLVCKVTSGESEEEPVKAVRKHEGREYGFCSERCAEAFEADPAAYIRPSFPRPTPAFALTDLAGRTLSPESLKGQVVLLDFWATWCIPCRKSMPELQALHDKYSKRGFTVIGVSIDEGGPSKVKKYVSAKKLTYPIAMDTSRSPAWDAFRVKAVPAAYLLDRSGQIVAQWTGVPADVAALESALLELLAAD
ncbi:MAG: redoxin domain-containing protein [Candidatus Eisenbacteria bacterium]|uniref:Redoxin domain-containing protein n=1 Tax=Eiseniibacteriota bacterium TaxID=2212470 RepID=A0A849SF08_UNCEI|nr:redoxin domain-containing protein [Candidatus Eisenbacteria bacterium]